MDCNGGGSAKNFCLTSYKSINTIILIKHNALNQKVFDFFFHRSKYIELCLISQNQICEPTDRFPSRKPLLIFLSEQGHRQKYYF